MTVFIRSFAVFLGFSLFASGCSPYVYKDEIGSFSTGVDGLATALKSGRKDLATADANLRQTDWTVRRAKLVVSPGCTLGVLEQADPQEPCQLKEVGVPLPSPSLIDVDSQKALVMAAAAKDYADALVAITNAGDREAFDAATGKLKAALSNLPKPATLSTAGGTIVELLGFLVGTALDHRRYEVLKASVPAAHQPLIVVGSAVGKNLSALRYARSVRLRQEADYLSQALARAPSAQEYEQIVARMRANTDAIELLRRSKPLEAADAMIAAHGELAKALLDNSRQVDAVFAAMSKFVAHVDAVQQALDAPASPNS